MYVALNFWTESRVQWEGMTVPIVNLNANFWDCRWNPILHNGHIYSIPPSGPKILQHSKFTVKSNPTIFNINYSLYHLCGNTHISSEVLVWDIVYRMENLNITFLPGNPVSWEIQCCQVEFEKEEKSADLIPK